MRERKKERKKERRVERMIVIVIVFKNADITVNAEGDTSTMQVLQM